MLARLFGLFAVAILVVSGKAQAELVIQITESSDTALPIAVVPFANKTGAGLPRDMARTIANDLQRSGDFSTLSTSKMLSLPSRSEQVYYRDWRLLGQNYVLIGQIESSANQKYRISYELLDVYGQNRILGEILSGTKQDFSRLAHYISDVVYEKITGVRGAFSTKIAYVTMKRFSNGKKEYRLQYADADGRNAFTLDKTSEPILSPAWSFDGKKIAYVKFYKRRPGIYIQDIKTGARTNITRYKGLNSAPTWSPDGRSLIVTLSKDGNAELYQIDLETKKAKRLTNQFGIDTEASWNPVSSQVVFTSDRSGSPQIYQMNLTDLQPQRLTFEGKYNARPRYSLDGKQLFFVHQEYGDFHIASMDLQSGEKFILTSTPLDESPSIAPNGRMLIYATRRNNKGVLAVVSVDGNTKYFLPSDYGEVQEPAWSPYMNE